jgi:hypothetical protein
VRQEKRFFGAKTFGPVTIYLKTKSSAAFSQDEHKILYTFARHVIRKWLKAIATF